MVNIFTYLKQSSIQNEACSWIRGLISPCASWEKNCSYDGNSAYMTACSPFETRQQQAWVSGENLAHFPQ